jgi:hypothetical protein
MPTYPTTPIPSVGTKDATVIPIIKSEAEGNYIRVRRRATRKRETLELKYSKMTYEDYDTLRTFFIENQGTAFTFVHPVSSAEYTVVFTMDKLERAMYETYVDVTVILEEL